MKNIKILFLLTVLGISCVGCSNSPKRNPNVPLVYVSFDNVDNNGNYFDEISGDALYSKGKPTMIDGLYNKACSFDGKSSLELNSFKGISGNMAHTIMCYVKTDIKKITTTLDYTIAMIGDTGGWNYSTLNIHYAEYSLESNDRNVFAQIPETDGGEWVNISLSYDGNGKYSLGINGAIKSTLKARDGLSIQESPLFIGGSFYGVECFIGEIDEFLIFDRFLDSKEIKSYMKKEVTFKTNSPNNKTPKSSDTNLFKELTRRFVPGQWSKLSFPSNNVVLDFIIHVPENYSENKKYPLLTFLHGDGSIGWEVNRILIGGEAIPILRTLDEYPDTICLIAVSKESWIPIDNLKGNDHLSHNTTLEKMHPCNYLLAYDELIEGLINNINIDSSKVYISGVSRGCMASWYLLNKHPNRFAGAILVEGIGPTDEECIKNFAKTPMWIFQSDSDELVCYDCVKEMSELVTKAGGEVKFTNVSGASHFATNVGVDNEDELLNWLYSHSKNQ